MLYKQRQYNANASWGDQEQLNGWRGHVSLLGECSNCSFSCRIKHEDVLLMFLHSSKRREIPGAAKSMDVLCKKQPNFPSSNQDKFQIRGKDVTANSCGIPWGTSSEFTRVNPHQPPEAASGPSALIAARADAEAPSTQVLPEGQDHAQTPTCLLPSALPVDTELISREIWKKGFSA